MLRDLTGKEEMDFPLPAESLPVGNLLELLFAEFPEAPRRRQGRRPANGHF